MINLYRTIWRLLDAQLRRRFVWLIALMIVTGVLDLAGVAVILPFLVVLSNPDVIFARPEFARIYEMLDFSSTFAFLQFLGVVIFVLVIGGIAVRAATSYMINRFVRATVMSLSHRRLAGYLSQPYEWFLSQHSAQLSKSVLQEITEVVTGAIAPAIRLIANGFLMLLLIGFLIAVEPIGALVIGTAFLVGFVGIYRVVGHRLGGMGADRLVANRERQQVVGEALTGIKEVKVLGMERQYLDRYLDPSRRLARYQAALALIGELPRYALEALAFGGMLLFVLYLLWSRDGALEEFLPIIGAFSFAAIKLMPTSQVLFRDLSLARYGGAALADLSEDLRELPKHDLPEATPGGFAPLSREIRLEGIRYRYPGADGDALSGISLSFPAGEAVGLAGSTGAGKTTVIDLLLGLIKPASGELSVDGTVIDSGNSRAWQERIGYVPQSIHLVDDTLAANIARGYSAGEIDRDRLTQAVDLAHLGEVIESLPEGLETPIGEAGVRLSGGQRQRIGIARALYRDPDLLVLDEATSALDAVTEAGVLKDILAARPGRTLVMITHRLHSLGLCDRIYFLKQGEVVASGDLADVERASSEFRAMRAAAE